MTETGHTFYIAFRVGAGVLVEERIDGGGHERDCGSRSRLGQSRVSRGAVRMDSGGGGWLRPRSIEETRGVHLTP
jgi:hypothetical protein